MRISKINSKLRLIGVVGGFDEFEAGIKVFGTRLAAEDIFLTLGDLFIDIERLNDMGADKDHEIGDVVVFFVVAKGSANEGKSTKTGNSGSMIDLCILDRSTEDKKAFIGNTDHCFCT